MTRIEDLTASVAKATEKVEKCKATIVRHLKQLEKKKTALAAKNGAHDPWEAYDIKHKEEDVIGATKKLKEAEGILAGWQAKLDKETEKERFLNDEAPQVIKDFLEQWKVRATSWHIKSVERYIEVKAKYDKAKKTATEKWEKEHAEPKYAYNPKKEKFIKEDKDVKKNGEILAMFGGFVATLASIRNEKERLEKLERELENEKKAKMLDLINRVNAVVVKITDASGLRINEKGNLDGIVKGSKAKAKLETIGAGGYNIQCFHYRTLVHELRK